MRLLPLLFLVACAAPHRELKDGARLPPPEPRTAYTPAGAGLPEYWAQPEPKPLPRSPYKRVLPETPETRRAPGIWASDVGGEPKAPPTLLGVPLPIGVDENDHVTRTSRACVTLLHAAIIKSGQALSGLSPQQRRCLGATLYFMCAYDDVRAYATRSASEKMASNRLRVLAEKLRSDECTPPIAAKHLSILYAIETAYREGEHE